MKRIHSVVLIICSIIGFTGHYLQFGIARFTAWIPACIGLSVLLLDLFFKKKKEWWWLNCLSVAMIMVFGMITTNMWLGFWSDEFQPLRKKIIFGVMSVSAWVTFAFFAGDRVMKFKERSKKIPDK